MTSPSQFGRLINIFLPFLFTLLRAGRSCSYSRETLVWSHFLAQEHSEFQGGRHFATRHSARQFIIHLYDRYTFSFVSHKTNRFRCAAEQLPTKRKRISLSAIRQLEDHDDARSTRRAIPHKCAISIDQ